MSERLIILAPMMKTRIGNPPVIPLPISKRLVVIFSEKLGSPLKNK